MNPDHTEQSIHNVYQVLFGYLKSNKNLYIVSRVFIGGLSGEYHFYELAHKINLFHLLLYIHKLIRYCAELYQLTTFGLDIIFQQKRL